MKRRDFLKTASSSALSLALANQVGAAKRGKRPIIIYLMLDEWGYYEMPGLGIRN